MSVTDYKFPTAEGQVNSDWGTPTNCYADDTNYSNTNATDTYDQQDFYHFDFQDDVPEGATIDGVELAAGAYRIGTTCDVEFRLQVGGTTVGDTKTVTWTNASPPTEKTAGGATDKWGLTPSAAEVRADNFGIWCHTAVADNTVVFDYVKIRIYYHQEITRDVSVAAAIVASKTASAAKPISASIAIGASKTAGVARAISAPIALGASKVTGISKSIAVSLGIDKSGQSYVTDYKSPSANGTTHAGWTDAANVYASDDVRATATTTVEGVVHDFTGFGLTTADIPDGATIDGFEVSIEGKNSGTSGVNEIEVLITANAGVGYDILGDNNNQQYTTTTDASKIFGSATDHTSTLFDDSDIRGANFGVVVFAYLVSGTRTFLCDHIKVRVYYTMPSVPFVKGVVRTCAVAVALTTTRALSIARAIAVTIQLTPSKIAAVAHAITAAIALSSHKHTSVVRTIAAAIGLTPSDKKHHFETYPGPTPGTGTGEKVISP